MPRWPRGRRPRARSVPGAGSPSRRTGVLPGNRRTTIGYALVPAARIRNPRPPSGRHTMFGFDAKTPEGVGLPWRERLRPLPVGARCPSSSRRASCGGCDCRLAKGPWSMDAACARAGRGRRSDPVSRRAREGPGRFGETGSLQVVPGCSWPTCDVRRVNEKGAATTKLPGEPGEVEIVIPGAARSIEKKRGLTGFAATTRCTISNVIPKAC